MKFWNIDDNVIEPIDDKCIDVIFTLNDGERNDFIREYFIFSNAGFKNGLIVNNYINFRK